MQMVSHTRNRTNGTETPSVGADTSGSDGNRNTTEPHPSPSPITLETFFTQYLESQRNVEHSQRNMEDIFRTVVDHYQSGNRQGGNEVDQYNNFKNFLDTEPLIFREAIEPLDVEEWINTMEDKFRLLRMTEVLKTEYAAHQLQGPTGIWWKHHRTIFPDHTQITWNEFTKAVCGVYIPSGLFEMKLQEFLVLTQDTKTVTQYLHAFNNLCHYAPDMVDTDIKKIASFKRVFNTKMLKHVGTNPRTRFNDFISDCLKQEKNNNVHSAFKARKKVLDSSPSQDRAPL
jgi:hypothetical protein